MQISRCMRGRGGGRRCMRLARQAKRRSGRLRISGRNKRSSSPTGARGFRNMMTEADFDDLNAHLEAVRPVFDEFCARHGFAHVDRRSLGRYPRIRIERAGSVRLWFDLWMQLNDDGRRFERFGPDLPYELSAGAYCDVDDVSGKRVRFQMAFQCFSGKPFEQVASALPSELEQNLETLESWTEQNPLGSSFTPPLLDIACHSSILTKRDRWSSTQMGDPPRLCRAAIRSLTLAGVPLRPELPSVIRRTITEGRPQLRVRDLPPRTGSASTTYCSPKDRRKC